MEQLNRGGVVIVSEAGLTSWQTAGLQERLCGI